MRLRHDFATLLHACDSSLRCRFDWRPSGQCGSSVIFPSLAMVLPRTGAGFLSRHDPRETPPGDPHQAGFFVSGLDSNFEKLDRMALAGAPAQAIIEMLRIDFEREEAKKVVKRPKDAKRKRERLQATKGGNVATVSDTERLEATMSDTPRARLFREANCVIRSSVRSSPKSDRPRGLSPRITRRIDIRPRFESWRLLQSANIEFVMKRLREPTGS